MGIAHELITRGWTQGAIKSDDGRVCLQGAMECAVFGNTSEESGWKWTTNVDEEARYFATREVVMDLLGRVYIGAWNDCPGRTFDEVLRVAKEADEILGDA